jgi:hypothetical protein
MGFINQQTSLGATTLYVIFVWGNHPIPLESITSFGVPGRIPVLSCSLCRFASSNLSDYGYFITINHHKPNLSTWMKQVIDVASQLRFPSSFYRSLHIISSHHRYFHMFDFRKTPVDVSPSSYIKYIIYIL